MAIMLISKKWVKPSSPTPPSCKYYKLSSVDQDTVDALVPVAFFYPIPKGRRITELFQLLETSLSKTLTYYYPFSGRLMDNNTYVDCNDAGVQLWEVQIQASMSEILDHSDFHAKDLVFPRGMYSYCTSVSSLVMIQLNYFECGGLGIGVCVSHKLGDAQTICNFVNDWAAIACGSPKVPSPDLSGASVLPSNPPSKTTSLMFMENICVTRRFVFSASSISHLKTMVAEDSRVEIISPSKVEVVTALIFKSAMAATKANTGSFGPYLLSQSGNFRNLTIPPLSENYVGNFTNNFLITVTEEKETKLSGLVGELRKSKLQFQDRHRKSLEGNELKLQLSRDSDDLRRKFCSNKFCVYLFTSWCRFPFYHVDFGWGNPKFVCTSSGFMKNVILLMDTQSGDGIEAFVTLEKNEMSIFEQDEELLTFASSNPNVSGVKA